MHKNILVMLASILWSIQAVCAPGFISRDGISSDEGGFIIPSSEVLKYNLQRAKTYIHVTLDSEYEAIKDLPKLGGNKKLDKSEILQPKDSLTRVFPRDVLAIIASLLPTVNFISLSRTCTHIYKLCFSEKVLMKHLNRHIKRCSVKMDINNIFFHHMAFRLVGLSDYVNPNFLYVERGGYMKQRLEELKKFHEARKGPFHELMVSHINNWPEEALVSPMEATMRAISESREVTGQMEQVLIQIGQPVVILSLPRP